MGVPRSDRPAPAWRRVHPPEPTVDRSLRYGERENGIELVWDRSATLANVELVRSGGGTTVCYGDRIAIRVAGGGHLRYGERDEGINLVWSSSPVYEWVIAGDRPTTPVPIRRRVQLVNVDHGDYLCYAERDTGINLRWWADTFVFIAYPPLPMPQQYRGPSGQPGQVELHGTAASLSVFHGGVDDELDWHIHLRLGELDRHVLYRHFIEHGKGAQTANFVPLNGFGPLREDQLSEISCEWMVLDAWQNMKSDEKFYSADVTSALRLQESAWSISWRVAEEQDLFGASETVRSGLTNMPVRVQGALVNDIEYRFKVEIHPLDSVAYAMAPTGARSIDADRPVVAGTRRGLAGRGVHQLVVPPCQLGRLRPTRPYDDVVPAAAGQRSSRPGGNDIGAPCAAPQPGSPRVRLGRRLPPHDRRPVHDVRREVALVGGRARPS